MKQKSIAEQVARNSQEFPLHKMNIVQGKIPQNIKGTYFRNGPGKIQYGNSVVEHWFFGNGALLKVVIQNGQCYAQFKDIQTQIHKQRQESQSFDDRGSMLVRGIKKFITGRKDHQANTSVLPLKNSQIVLALCQAGYPLKIRKRDLFQLGFDNFYSIKTAYSAHPKVDPDNGDIYNVGMQNPFVQIMKHNKEMLPICTVDLKLSYIQSIHDFCLAGDYIVIFQHPMQFGILDFLQPTSQIFNTYNPKGKVLIHILKKSNFQVIKKIQSQSFYSFHFTNGYSTEDQIVVEFCKYEGQQGKKLLNFVKEYPTMALGEKINQQFHSVLQEKRISLKDFSVKSHTESINCQFPICDEQLVGKNWRYSYFLSTSNQSGFFYNVLVKYDRQQHKMIKKILGQECASSEPILIPVKNGQGKQEPTYILLAKVMNGKSFIQLFTQDTLEQVCLIQLPVIVPNGFHGKWQNQIYE